MSKSVAKSNGADLEPKERRELDKLEKVIAADLRSFRTVGDALTKIRDKRLYRATDATFAAYCCRRWKLGKSHVYRLIAAAELGQLLSPIGDKLSLSSEAQARELAALPPDIQAQVWSQATADGSDPAPAELRELVSEVTLGDVQREEAEALSKRSPSDPGDGARDALAQLVRLLERARKVAGRIGPPAEAVIELIEKAIAEAGVVSV